MSEGNRGAFDSIALHPYAANTGASLAQLNAARAVATRPATARSASGHGDRLGLRRTLVESLREGRRRQAELLAKTLRNRSQGKLNLKGVFWYSCATSPSELICDWCGYAGLRGSRLGKPAWDRFTALATG